jgi:hypothetical protein
MKALAIAEQHTGTMPGLSEVGEQFERLFL